MAQRDDRIARLSPGQRARLATALARRARDGAPLPRRDPGAPPPLSFAQERSVALRGREPSAAAPRVIALRLSGPLDAAALERALGELVRRHAVLRTALVDAAGAPAARVAAAAPLALARDDLRRLRPARQGEALRQVRAEAARPFDLAAPPLLRARLAALSEDEHLLLLAADPAACDAPSWGILLGELAALYPALARGAPSPLPEPALQHADVAAWARARAGAGEGELDLAWWRHRLAAPLPPLDLLADRPAAARSGRAARHAFHLPAERWRPLAELARAAQATPFQALLAGLAALLHRLSGAERVAVAAPSPGRERAGLEGVVGPLAGALPLVVDLSGAPSYRELVRRAREATLEASAHRAAAPARVESALDAGGRRAGPTVALALEAPARRAVEVPGLSVELLEAEGGPALADLALSAREVDDGLALAVACDDGRFGAAAPARLARQLQVLLASAAAEPDRPVATLPLAAEPERRRILGGWNATAARYPHERCLHQLFQAQAARTPDAAAVLAGGARLTYRALDAQASRVARHLRRLGLARGRPAGLLGMPLPETVAAFFGILEAGGACVPLDPAAPPAELAETVAAAGLEVVVAGAEVPAGAVPPGVEVVRLDAPERAARLAAEPARHLQPIAAAEDVAAVVPAGAEGGRRRLARVSHRAAANLWHGLQRGPYAGREAPLRVGLGPLASAAALRQLLALLSGHALVLLPASGGAAARAAREAQVDVLACAAPELPALRAAGLLDPAGGGPGLLLVAAEQLDAAAWRALAAGPADAWTLNAPDGCGVDALAARVAGDAPHAGRPLANVRAYVLDAAGALLPPGVPGALWVAGAAVGQGYLGLPAVNAERFAADPFAPGERMFRTGARARWRDDGALELLPEAAAPAEATAARAPRPAAPAAAGGRAEAPDDGLFEAGWHALAAGGAARPSPAGGMAP